MAGNATLGPIIKFYSAWFCPYAQRTWIALNHLNLDFELIEALKFNEKNEYIKDENLLKLNAKGLVPTLDVNNEVVADSIYTVEYLNKHFGDKQTNFVTSDLVKDAHLVNKNVCSPFYRILLKEERSEQDTAWEELVNGLQMFTESIQTNGFFKSSSMNIVDITLFPWANRLCVLENFRQYCLDKNLGWVQEFFMWYERMLDSNAVLSTVPDKDGLIKIYSRYAQGTAKSKVADVVRAGKEAHDLE